MALVINLIKKAEQNGLYISEIESCNVQIGQGLNITKNYLIDKNFINKSDIKPYNIFTSKDNAPFVIIDTQYVLVDEKYKSQIDIGDHKFYRKKTKIPPSLIMPRGLGRHFCALNKINSYSASNVEVYVKNGNDNEETIMNLWLYLNSSLAWLIRELSGRKNLGGGMLKAEAIDLKYFKLYYDFNRINDINSIYNKLSKRASIDTVSEIETMEHKEIDEIVFNHMNFESDERELIVSKLQSLILQRSKKSTTQSNNIE